MAFSVNINASDGQIELAKKKILSNGGTINGNHFSVKGVDGYIKGNHTVVITDTPWLVSDSYIAQEIKNFFK